MIQVSIQRPWEIAKMLRLALPTLLFLVPTFLCADDYVPPRGAWQTLSPTQAGFDADRLQAALDLMQAEIVVEPQDLAIPINEAFGHEPGFRILGPTAPREAGSAIIIRQGRIVAEFGPVRRVDMTFSAVKSYLSTMYALAWRDGLVSGHDQRVGERVLTGEFDSDHNADITWRHLLNQTSDWSGTLWDTPDWADRPVGDDPEAWPNRELHTPGTHYKYNDVRVNLLAYSLLQVWRKPLPVVLREEVMDPIGASSTWRWHGYENSWVVLDGQHMQSVSGGGHFGGGLFISARDHARFGLLFLRNGRWGDRQIVPEDWFEAMLEPTPVRRDYGFMWWLNTDRERIPEAPASAFWAAGFGGNYIWVDRDNDLLVVMRWIPDLNKVIPAIYAAMEPGADTVSAPN